MGLCVLLVKGSVFSEASFLLIHETERGHGGPVLPLLASEGTGDLVPPNSWTTSCSSVSVKASPDDGLRADKQKELKITPGKEKRLFKNRGNNEMGL